MYWNLSQYIHVGKITLANSRDAQPDIGVTFSPILWQMPHDSFWSLRQQPVNQIRGILDNLPCLISPIIGIGMKEISQRATKNPLTLICRFSLALPLVWVLPSLRSVNLAPWLTTL